MILNEFTYVKFHGYNIALGIFLMIRKNIKLFIFDTK